MVDYPGVVPEDFIVSPRGDSPGLYCAFPWRFSKYLFNRFEEVPQVFLERLKGNSPGLHHVTFWRFPRSSFSRSEEFPKVTFSWATSRKFLTPLSCPGTSPVLGPP